MIRRIQCLTFLAAGMVPATPMYGKNIDLTPRFEVGATTYYLSRSTIDHRIQVELADVDQKVKLTTESGMALRVVEVDSNGVAQLEWTLHFVAIASDSDMPGIDGKLDYDSRKPGATASRLWPIFTPLLKKPIGLSVDPRGKVLRCAAPPAADPLDPLTTLVQSVLSAQAFEQLPLFITADAPRPAPYRSEWTSASSMELPLNAGALALVQNFRFERTSPRRNLARIRMLGTITQATANPQAGQGVAALAPQSLLAVESGKVQGVYQWDYAIGRIATAETTIDLVTTLNSVLGPMKLSQRSITALQSATPQELGLPIERAPLPRATPTPEKVKDDE